MDNPLVSIIVPVYNVEKYIRQCLDSILTQTYSNIEAVLVNDGSIDNSGTICDEYASKDARIIVIHKKNEGVALARITAFEHCKGELITFIDSDDYVDTHYIEKMASHILTYNADMVSCDYYNVIEGKVFCPRPKKSGVFCGNQISKFISESFFYDPLTKGYGMTCFLCTKMIKRKLIGEGLKEGVGLWYGEDQIVVFHILQACEKMVLIPDNLYYYVQHEGQAMKRYDMQLWNNILSLMQKYEEMDKNGLSEEGRRIRTWIHIRNTIFEKMSKANLSRKEFSRQLSIIRNKPFVVDFFKPNSLRLTFKSNVAYWILKLKLFDICYFYGKFQK